jgi:cytochrome P450
MDFNSLSDPHNKWVRYYDEIRVGLMKPLFLILPRLDTKYLGWFKKRQETHKMLSEFINTIDDIINEKRELVREKKNDDQNDAEKDLLTLMLESETAEEGKGLSNEELRVSNTHYTLGD